VRRATRPGRVRAPLGHGQPRPRPAGAAYASDAAIPTPHCSVSVVIVEVPLPADAVLALYTDGLVEERDTDLGTALNSLADVLARTPSRSLDALADALLDQAGQTTKGHDDIALLLIAPRRLGS
jgi:serine/threonine protein phosphatase PrpC